MISEQIIICYKQAKREIIKSRKSEIYRNNFHFTVSNISIGLKARLLAVSSVASEGRLSEK